MVKKKYKTQDGRKDKQTDTNKAATLERSLPGQVTEVTQAAV